MNEQRYHYLECGLDDVYLVNGFERSDTARGTSIAIREIDALHRVIGEHLCRKRRELSGKEIRFLRREMLMSQAVLASFLDVKEQTIHRWESEKVAMPRATEWLMRLLYMNEVPSVRDRLKRIADLEDEIDHRHDMNLKFKKIRQKGKQARRALAPEPWELEAA